MDLDGSSRTGESLPVTHRIDSAVMSGALNGTRAFVLEATASAADSQYAAIVSLVQQAAESRAPVVRLADRYAVPSTAVAVAIVNALRAMNPGPHEAERLGDHAAPAGGSGRPCRPERRVQPSRDWKRTKARSSSPSTSRDSRNPWAS
ncbi:hypothetical protein ACIQ00_01660 [Micrococcus luteus]|uniref:P-type ATPase n=1 Tax=Micrococcus luteus TaxID=1270 RepID=UPI002A45E222|nr:hypothetical protein [Micrococcus luteus]MCV7493385.1 hypothetical protein [Micrococcus luteus]